MAERNRSLRLDKKEIPALRKKLLKPATSLTLKKAQDRIILGEMESVAPLLPYGCVDLLILDPPYNLHKRFGSKQFSKQPMDCYTAILTAWIEPLVPLLKADASIYICGDWQNSPAIYQAANSFFTIRNRISWEREKGRGAKRNWKNCSEDIWFCTLGEEYYFDVEAVKLRRKVLTPYRNAEGVAKDWQEDKKGRFRITHPSNLWTDITIPFWSMPENTDHPTQKPEKLIAKLILASCPEGGLVLDPFCGSGTTAAVAKKLGRHFIGIEQDVDFAALAQKRVELAAQSSDIQGYQDGIFWERNSTPAAKKTPDSKKSRKKAVKKSA